MPTIKQFEEFTSQWQSDHKGKYPTSFDYFLAIWEAAKKDEATEIERLKNDLDIVYAALQKQNIRIEGQTMNTPRTDALLPKSPAIGPKDLIEWVDAAIDSHRQLETEVQELRAALEKSLKWSACRGLESDVTNGIEESERTKISTDYCADVDFIRAALAKVPK